MRTADRRNILALLASILLLAPQLALAQSCTISFDQNAITAGQGTNLHWVANLTREVAPSAGGPDSGDGTAVQITVLNSSKPNR